MKQYSILIFLLMVVFTVSSCEDYLDVNDDPNYATNASSKEILPPAVLSLSGQIGGYYNILGSLWSQHFTQTNVANQYKDFDSYNVTREDFRTPFQDMFAGGLNDLYTVQQTSYSSEDWGGYLMAVTLKAFGMQIMIDYYGDLPYSEAFRATEGIYQPKFDSASSIYDQLIVEIDTALSKFKSAPASLIKTVGNEDLVFNGDFVAWQKFANTLKLKIYLRQRFARPQVAESGIKAMMEANDFIGFLDTDAKVDVFIDEGDKSNPMYEDDRRRLNTTNNLVASWTTLSFLEKNGDPRIPLLYTAGSGGQAGMVQGNFDAPSSDYPNGILSLANLMPQDPVYFINEAESYFLQAEADLVYNSGANAKELFDRGIEASFARYALEDSAFVDAKYAFPAGTDEEKFEAIIFHKWLSMIKIQGYESFLERTRTGYPRSSTLTAQQVEDDKEGYQNTEAGSFIYPLKGITGGVFAKKLVYSKLLIDRNSNTPVQSTDEIQKGVWWFRINPNSPIPETK